MAEFEQNNNELVDSAKTVKKEKKPLDLVGNFYELVEMLAFVTILVLMCFAFVVRLNIVDGQSMEQTLHHGESLAVSNLFYEPKAGDIVIIHDISAVPYNEPIVKRVVAVGGQTVDIDFDTWTLTVDGKVIEEDYRWIDNTETLTADYAFPITIGEDEVFVLGDNRNHSADSRQIEIGPVDKRCIVGRALVRLVPIDKFTIFN